MTRDGRGDHGDTNDHGDADSLGDDDRGERVAAGLEAGIALFNAGYVLAARDRWRSTRVAIADDAPADAGTEPGGERVLRGLVAVATAADHAGSGERSGAADHGTRAVDLLEGIDDACHGTDLEPIREWCRRLAADPGAIGDGPPPIRIDGVAVGFEDLDLAATLSAASALSAVVDAGDEETMSAAAALAREEHGTGRTQVTELLFAYLRRPEARPQIAARIADHVDRDRRKGRDVSGLFE
ncbi:MULTISPECIES: DUF309 domain-containing protein [Haloferacaceae]|uniref:DUF309 domain-containing protein n=1 Tax=Halorubrum glutamatedens TaxID=2707018 RepID=A0ABD5QPU9_9EURY|nr:DUF309 domain-containing protein [Halobellus captivus]